LLSKLLKTALITASLAFVIFIVSVYTFAITDERVHKQINQVLELSNIIHQETGFRISSAYEIEDKITKQPFLELKVVVDSENYENQELVKTISDLARKNFDSTKTYHLVTVRFDLVTDFYLFEISKSRIYNVNYEN